MVNVALLVVAGATFLNSISVILLAVYARKKEKEIRKLKLEQDKMWKSTTENIWVSDQSRDKQIENLQKGHYGYDKDQTTFRAAYAALRDSMALSGDYGKKEVNQDG